MSQSKFYKFLQKLLCVAKVKNASHGISDHTDKVFYPNDMTTVSKEYVQTPYNKNKTGN